MLCRDAQVPEEKEIRAVFRSCIRRRNRNIENGVAALIEQGYEKILEEEQLEAGWEEDDI